ncbi:MAG: HEPN domain-containing protein, partial [Stellaceae bacterium]
NTAAPPVRDYVESELRWFQNPNIQKTFDLLRQFNPDWADQLKTATDGEVLDAVDSVNNNRNNIVHGRQVSISFAVIQRYYADIKAFVATILAIIP